MWFKKIRKSQSNVWKIIFCAERVIKNCIFNAFLRSVIFTGEMDKDICDFSLDTSF